MMRRFGEKDWAVVMTEAIETVAAGVTSSVNGAPNAHPALYYLNRLKAAVGRAVTPGMIAGEMDALERFWRENVNWCDPLSREIEKIIILYADVENG